MLHASGVNVMAEQGHVVISIYEHAVAHAMNRLAAHDTQPVRALYQQITDPKVATDSCLTAVVRQLSRQVSWLDNISVQPLVASIVDLNYIGKPELTEAYLRFVSVLASGFPKWWPNIATAAIRNFVRSPSETEAQHQIIDNILQVVPISLGRVGKQLSAGFPRTLAPCDEIVNYIRNLILLADRHPELERTVWFLIVQRITRLDVECGDLLDFEDDEDLDNDDEAEQEADESGGLPQVDQSASADAEEPAAKKLKLSDNIEDGDQVFADSLTVESTASRLDAVMIVLFEYFDKQFAQSGDRHELFIILLDAFKEYILPTHTTRAVQFMIFYVAHRQQDLLDAFLASVVEMAMSPTTPVDRRHKAMQYIASFVARANGISTPQLIFITGFMSGWVNKYIIEREVEVDSTVSMARFRMFYAAVQALFYIFCFRHAQLKTEDEAGNIGWEANIDKLFQHAITTKFNPLRYCKQTVVSMFAKIAQQEHVAFCHTIIEQNKRGIRRTGPALPGDTAASNLSWPGHKEFKVLESFFPFDPLPESLIGIKSAVEGFYVQWEDVAASESSASDDDCDNDDSSDDDDSASEKDTDILSNDEHE